MVASLTNDGNGVQMLGLLGNFNGRPCLDQVSQNSLSPVLRKSVLLEHMNNVLIQGSFISLSQTLKLLV